jgi:hypothetical protein
MKLGASTGFDLFSYNSCQIIIAMRQCPIIAFSFHQNKQRAESTNAKSIGLDLDMASSIIVSTN